MCFPCTDVTRALDVENRSSNLDETSNDVSSCKVRHDDNLHQRCPMTDVCHALGRYTYGIGVRGAAIAQWIWLRPPSLCLRFETRAHKLCFYYSKSNACYICRVKRKKLNKRRPRLTHLKSLILDRFISRLSS